MLKMYAIRDQESQTHSHAPLGFPTDRDALHAFRELANDKKTTIGKFPNDYQLVRIGEYDPRLGIMQPSEHESLCWANELVTAKPEEIQC
jgi:hypothetical protein